MAIEINEGLIIEKKRTHAEMLSISSPITNTIIVPSDMNEIYRYNGTDWNPVNSRNKIIINRKEDLPGYSTSTITFAANKKYEAVNRDANYDLGSKNVIFGDRCIINFIELHTSGTYTAQGSVGFNRSVLSKSGDGTLLTANLTAANKLISFVNSNLALSAPTTSNKFFDIVTTGANCFFTFLDITAIGTGSAIGELDGFITKGDGLSTAGYTTGLYIRNSNGVTMRNVQFLGGADAGVSLMNFDDGPYGSINIDSMRLTLGSNDYGYYFKDTETFAEGVNVSKGTVSNTARAFAANSFTNKSPGIFFDTVGKIQSSIATAFGYFSAENTDTATDLSSQGAYVDINTKDLLIADATVTQRFTISANGEVTYTDTADTIANVKFSPVVYHSAGVDHNFTIAIFVDSGGGYNLVSGSEGRAGVANTKPLTISTEAKLELKTGYKVRAYIADNNATVTDPIIRFMRVNIK